MTPFRFRGSATMAVVLALAIIQPTIAQPVSARPYLSITSDSADPSYKIYSLNDFGNDPGLCEWIAQTIPEVIAAGTWKGPGVIRYYAPKNILVVSHTSAVQAQVEIFLKDVKKSLSEATKARAETPKSHASGSEVVPAAYHKPELRKAAKPTSEPNLSYPVLAQPKAPKHLFHYIIRYEGEGIIDDNIVKALKDYYRVMKEASQTTTAPAPTAYQTTTAPGSAPPGPTPYSPPVSPTANQTTTAPAPTGYSPPVSPTPDTPSAPLPPTPESSSYGASPATSKPLVKEKKKRKTIKEQKK